VRGAALPIFSARSSILFLLVRSIFSFISLIRSPVIAAAASIGRRLPLSVRAFTSAQGIPVTGKSGVDLISISVPFAGCGCVGWDISGTWFMLR
jgi:hypothetical protein